MWDVFNNGFSFAPIKFSSCQSDVTSQIFWIKSLNDTTEFIYRSQIFWIKSLNDTIEFIYIYNMDVGKFVCTSIRS